MSVEAQQNLDMARKMLELQGEKSDAIDRANAAEARVAELEAAARIATHGAARKMNASLRSEVRGLKARLTQLNAELNDLVDDHGRLGAAFRDVCLAVEAENWGSAQSVVAEKWNGPDAPRDVKETWRVYGDKIVIQGRRNKDKELVAVMGCESRHMRLQLIVHKGDEDVMFFEGRALTDVVRGSLGSWITDEPEKAWTSETPPKNGES